LHGRDLGAHTGLFLLDELVTAIHGSSAHLRHVRVLARGGLRADCRAAGLLDGWTDGFRQRWGAVGITVEIILDHRVHTRRVVLQGVAAAVEASAEWGLMVYMDNVANLLHEPAARQVRHTEFQAVSLNGTWIDPLQSSTCSEPPADECAPPGALAVLPAGPHTGGHLHPAILAMSQLPGQPAVHTVRGDGGVQGRSRRVSQWPRHAAQFGRPRSAHVVGARFRQDGPMLRLLKGSARPRSPAVGLPCGASSSSWPYSRQRRCHSLPTPILHRRRD
jgi:hypothetical protein